MRRKFLLTILCLTFLVSFSFPVCAKEFTSQRNGLDVMFVIDSSGSMAANDPDRIGMSMVKAFIDTVHIKNIRIGFTAYSDRIVSVSSPVPIEDAGAREELKGQLDRILYSGDTDMGLGVKTALEALPEEEGRDRILVVISDGETDLPDGTGRTEVQSREDLMQCVETCSQEQIPVYGIAFGQYEGDQDSLLEIASRTGGEACQVTKPEDLIEILYGIFNDNFSYKIQQLSSGIYDQGVQEIRIAPDEPYLDEMDLLLISSGSVGDTTLQYGNTEISLSVSGNYGVGKIAYEAMDDTVEEMFLTTSTAQGQDLKLYLISYRELLPVFSIEETAEKNTQITYQVYFKDRQGQVITDEGFYSRFQWNLDTGEDGGLKQSPAALSGGVLEGQVSAGRSGTYHLRGVLEDNLGSYPFEADLTVGNTPPSGNVPELRLGRLGGEKVYHLDDYFQDADNDSLTYSLQSGSEGRAKARLEDSDLILSPQKGGWQTLTLLVSDGEETVAYPVRIRVASLAESFWWAILLAAAAAGAIIYKRFYKPKPQVEVIARKKQENRFAGKMDAYVTVQPEGTEEIPPLTFPMYKIRDAKVCLGDLMREYPELTEVLRLDLIYLIADEGRRMILYHTSPSTVMTGSSILCRKIQYSLGFGDVLYITAPDGSYELELHYIAVIQ